MWKINTRAVLKHFVLHEKKLEFENIIIMSPQGNIASALSVVRQNVGVSKTVN